MIQKITIILIAILCIANVYILSQTANYSQEASKIEKDMKRITEEIIDLEAKVVQETSLDTIANSAKDLTLIEKPNTIFMDSVVYAQR